MIQERYSKILPLQQRVHQLFKGGSLYPVDKT